MTDSSTLKNFEFKIVDSFGGYVSSVDRTKLAPNMMATGSQNMYKKLSGNLSVREGMKRRGVANTAVSPISSEFIWNTSWGATLPLIISESKLQVEYSGAYYTLLSSLTKTKYIFDKWWDNSAKKDKVLFVNGTDDMFSWSGGISVIVSATANTITKNDATTTWQQDGFTQTGSLLLNGTTYTYTGGYDTTVLTGVTPSPAAEATLSVALQTVVTNTNTPATDFLSDFIKVVNNQVYVGSYTSRLCYISKNDDFTDYTQATPRIPGDGELLTLDSALKGIGVRNGNAFIGFGSGEWAEVKFLDVTVGTTLTQQTIVDIKPVSKLGAPYSHEFIGNSGNNIIYLAQDQQVRMMGDFNNAFTAGYPSLSQEIATELSDADFTGGGLKCIGDFVYLTAPVSGKVYLYQVRQSINENGEVVAERLWHAPMTWAATRIDEIDGVTYAFSNANPQVYQIWDTEQWHDDSPSDEELPYSCILNFGYSNGGRRYGLLNFDKFYTEGYIESGTDVDLIINYDYQGAKTVLTSNINGGGHTVYTFGGTASSTSTASSLGDESLGDAPLGDGISSAFVDNLPKFRSINCFALTNCFEYQPTYVSDAADSRWEISALGSNARVAEQNPSYIINK